MSCLEQYKPLISKLAMPSKVGTTDSNIILNL